MKKEPVKRKRAATKDILPTEEAVTVLLDDDEEAVTPAVKKDLPEPSKILRGLVETYYDVQHNRIQVENQLRAYEQDVSEQEETFVKEVVLSRLKDVEKDLVKYFEKELLKYEIYTAWLGDIKGIGPVLAAGLLVWLKSVHNYSTISKIWAYSGYSAGYVKSQCPKGHKVISSSLPASCPVFKDNKKGKCEQPMTLIEKIDGTPAKRTTGYMLMQNTRLKTHLWKIGESFVKTNGGYRQLYNQFRADYDQKWQTPADCKSVGCKNKKKCLDGHRYAAAKRKTLKVFLAHLWQKWAELEGLPHQEVFIIGRPDPRGVTHSHPIPIVRE